MLKFHDIYLWHHYTSQRDRLITQYTAELRAGFSLQFAVPATWGRWDCTAVAQEVSAALTATGAHNTAYVHTERVAGFGRSVSFYSIMVEGV